MTTYRKILRCNLQFPADMSVAARDLIGRLVQVCVENHCQHVCSCVIYQHADTQVDLSKRLGTLANGVADIKQHYWFRGFDWAAAGQRAMSAPIRPVVHGAADTSNFDDYSHVEHLKKACDLSPAEQALFHGL